jgi:hypothetical protein
MTYEFEVEECNHDPNYFKVESLSLPKGDDEIEEGGFYYLKAHGLNKFGKEMVLDVSS